MVKCFKEYINKDNRRRARFIQFQDFYASITKDLLVKALSCADQYTNITQLDRVIIFHARKTLLFSQKNEWLKTVDIANAFGVSMGSFDGAGI